MQRGNKMLMRGHLRIFVLEALSRKESSGYALMTALSNMLGKKPSPGSMYPLLEDLAKEGFVEFRKDKNDETKKIYKITTKGKEFLSNLMKDRSEIVNRIKKMHDFYVGLDAKHSPHFERFKNMDYIDAGIYYHMQQIGDALMHIAAEKNIKKDRVLRDTIYKILDNAAKELKKLKKCERIL